MEITELTVGAYQTNCYIVTSDDKSAVIVDPGAEADKIINKAKELLCEADVSVSDAAELVGYRDLKYFSRLFKKTTGISPSDYKKLYR